MKSARRLIRIPSPLFWTALLSYVAAVGLALSLNPQFIPTDARGGPLRLFLVFLLWVANYAEARIAVKHRPSGKRSESAWWALHASLAVVVLALVPYGLDALQELVETGSVTSRAAPALGVGVAILGFWGYCKVGKIWVRQDDSRASQPPKPKKKRSKTYILMTRCEA